MGENRLLTPQGLWMTAQGSTTIGRRSLGQDGGIETQPQRGCGVTIPRTERSDSGTRVGVRPVASAYPQGSRPDGLIPGLSSTSPLGMGAAAGRITALSKERSDARCLYSELLGAGSPTLDYV